MPTTLLDVYCPIAPTISPHADTTEEWLDGWIRRHGLPPEYADRLVDGRIARYAARLYPDASAADLRVVAALFTWFFLADDECDRTSVPEPDRVRGLVTGALGSLRTGTAFAGPLGHILADAWREPRRRMSAGWRARFIRAVEHHLHGVVVEARNKAAGRRPGITEYVELRRATSAAYVAHTLVDFAARIRVPATVLHHPAVREFSKAGNDLLSWFNDLLSLDRDAAVSGGHNLVLALAHERGLPIAAAVEEARAQWHQTMRRLPELRAAVPPFGPAAQRYLDGVEYAVRGTIDWSLESARYR